MALFDPARNCGKVRRTTLEHVVAVREVLFQGEQLQIPTIAATNSNLIPATVPI
jgi:hypothetical protein